MRDDLVVRFENDAEHLAEFVIVRFNEEGTVLQHAAQEVLRRVHDDAAAAPR